MTTDPSHEESPMDELDANIEGLIRDSYDAPPLPGSVLYRVDRLLTEEWGRSPELVISRTTQWQRAVVSRMKWLKGVPVAASIALVLGMVLMFGRGQSAYGWSSMIQALEKHGVVQLSGPGVKRWLSLSDLVLSERTDKTLTLLDVRNDELLQRDSEDIQARRQKVPKQIVADRDLLVLAFFLGDPASTISSNRLKGARLIKEHWAQPADGSNVSLHSYWQTDRGEQLEIRLDIDPVTGLPSSYEVPGDTTSNKSLAWSYPRTTAAELRLIDFPSNIAIVDVGADGKPMNASAVLASNEKGNVERKNQTVTGHTDASDKPEVRVADASGGASLQWKAIELNSQPTDELVSRVNLLMRDTWERNGIQPAPRAEDTELLRRVYLDLCGRTPSVHEIRSYLADKSANRYEVLVDRLLRSRDHASHMATVWRSFLIPEGVDLTAFGGVDAFDRWLAEKFGNNESYDSVVRSLLLAEGRLSRSGPLLFYSAAKLDPDVLAARSARVFLGMRLECAQCHDHPFEPWKQEEFWGFAAFFAQISRPRGELQAVSTVMQVRDVDHGDVKLPKSNQVIAPHFLDGRNPSDEARNSDGVAEPRRQQLAKWLTSAKNPYFSRATANRVWSIMFGKGIVDPVDDFGIRHQPKSPELLELLAGHFAGTTFDLREMFRVIALSEPYRLSSGAESADEQRLEWFAQMNVKTFTAEQVYDCITVATMLDASMPADPYSFNIARYGNADRESFLQLFRTPAGRSTEYQGGIPQALTLMNGRLIGNATGLSNSGLLKSLDAPFFTNKQRVEVLYLATLSRYPRPVEWAQLDEYVNDRTPKTELHESLSDILWALLNSAEFTMNH